MVCCFAAASASIAPDYTPHRHGTLSAQVLVSPVPDSASLRRDNPAASVLGSSEIRLKTLIFPLSLSRTIKALSLSLSSGSVAPITRPKFAKCRPLLIRTRQARPTTRNSLSLASYSIDDLPRDAHKRLPP